MSRAARTSDLHYCPKSDGSKPHLGGPVTGGASNVEIGGRPAARAGDACRCASPAPNQIVSGSETVEIESAAAARMGDPTKHGGAVRSGCPTVEIGG
jgi:uncharacterized Zn-binding protein involved in type VI secretion